MFCNASTFLGRGFWIPSRVIQYPRYLISNLAKCDLLALTLSPASLSLKKTFSRCSLNVEHNVTSKSLMYAQTYYKSKRAQTCALEKCWDYNDRCPDTHGNVYVLHSLSLHKLHLRYAMAHTALTPMLSIG